MMVARWHIDARFGHKQKVIDAVKAWCRDIGAQIGWSADKLRITTGSVGALESTVEVEVTLRDLAELGASWVKLAGIEAHRQWSQALEPDVVSATTRWEVFRVV
jgi:hypothetical protein